LIAVLAVLLFAQQAHAQRNYAEVRLDQMQPASPGSPFTRAEGPHDIFDEGIGWGVRTTIDYGHRLFYSQLIQGDEEEGDPIHVVENALLLHLGAAIDPLYWLRGELHFPLALFENGSGDEGRVSGQDLPPPEAPAPGDLRIGAHARPYSTDELDVSIGVRVWAPTGAAPGRAAYMSGRDAFARVELVPAVAGEIDVVLYGCTLGIAPMFFAGRDGDRLAASCAAHFKVAPFVTVGIEPHVALFSYADFDAESVDDDIARKHVPGWDEATVAVQFEPLAAAMFRIGEFNIGAAIGPGIGNAPGTARVRALLTLQYASQTTPKKIERPPPDDDLDGLPNAYDACPKQAGSKEQRGCPSERDKDGDGIIEGDACPDQLGARHSDPKANGCPDGDNDRYPDPIDPCPVEPGVETEGCPKHARLEGGQFVITPPIAFLGLTAKLTADSRAAFVEIIRTMRANPKLELVSVGVGTKGTPPKLTDQRAKEILVLFDEQNFPSDRYEVVLNDELKGGQVAVRVVR
jgi:hypothetical protein